MSELFPVQQVSADSPRLRWLKKWGVQIKDNGQGGEDEGGEWLRFAAISEKSRAFGQGNTEDEALQDLALKNRWLMWTEGGV